MNTVRKYLATTTSQRYTPAINHGAVNITDDGFIVGGINDGVPIEGLGEFIVRDEPFPDDSDELDMLFFDMRESNE